MKNFPLLKRLTCDIPFISADALGHMMRMASEPMAAEHPYLKELREKTKPKLEIAGDIAIVPVSGVLCYKPDAWETVYGIEDTSALIEIFNTAANDPAIHGVLLEVNSPGGFITGGPDLAEAVRRCGKPTASWVGGDMCSLAYYIGSQAQAVVSSASARVGSIGAYTYHVDMSEAYKAEGIKVEVIRNKEGDLKASGAFGTPLTEDQRNEIQASVQRTFDEFKKVVTAARPGVSDDSMRGQVFSGREAKKLGLVDAIGDRNYAMSILRRAIRSTAK